MDTGGWTYVGVAWRWRWGNIWIIFLAVSLILPTVDGQEYFAKGCPGGEADSPPVEVTLTCPEGQVISLGEAKFGRNQYKHCTITDGDCLDNTDAFIGCKGRHNCTVHFDRPFSPTCGYTTFITVTYDCQTVTTTAPPMVQMPTSTPSVSRPVNVITPSPTGVKPDTEDNTQSGLGDSDENNAALIAGCVVAVIITVVLLIIAIIMVVRRLACGAELSDEEEKKSSSCTIFPCLPVEHENGPKHKQDEAGSHISGENEDKKRSKRKRKHRGWWADKNQNMSSRLAPLGQEDEEGASSSQSRSVAAPARASVYSEVGAAGGAPGRSSLAMESNAPLKRHSSGAKSANSDFIKEQGGREVSELDDFSRRGGEEIGAWWGVLTQGMGVASFRGSGRMNATDLSIPNQDRVPPSRIPMHPADKYNAVKISKLRNQFDAIAVPNTETFTSC